MTANDKAFTGSIPTLYDAHLGPFLFEPFAADMAKRLAGFEGELLEVAAGTGIVTRALDRALAPSATITATDLNQAMIDVAAAKVVSSRIAWRPADAQALPFEDDSFDAAVCQFGVMFYPDRIAAHREVRRVLRPGGRYLFNVWDSVDHNEVAKIAGSTVAALFPDDPPRFLERTPYGYFDRDRIRADLAAGGFEDVEIETVGLPTRTSAADAAMGFCQGTPLRADFESRGPDALARATEAARQALAQRFGEGPFDTRIQAHVVTARI